MNKKISNYCQIASVSRYTITEGRAKGIDVIDCNNGKMRFTLNVTHALDIMQVWHEGLNVSYVSKNGFTNRNYPFMKRFEGGMLYSCGLDSVGDRDGFEPHGSLHCTEAEIISANCNDDGISVCAAIRCTELFGRNLVLYRCVESAIGSNNIIVKDTLVNEGHRDEDYALLYHVNVGYPMLDEGSEIVADISSVKPRTEWAAKDMDNMLKIGAPIDNEEERCYFLKLNKKEISLVNKTFGKEFALSYCGDALDNFVEWRSMASGEYVLGLEPSTTELDEGFEYKTIKSGESLNFSLVIAINNI